MPTIYDILPKLEKEIINMTEKFTLEDNGKFHTWEITVMLPGVNTFLHFMGGVNLSLKESNYVSATANLRGMMEVLGAIAYDGVAKLCPKHTKDL